MAPLLPSVVAELGPLELIEFSAHLGMLALYTVAARSDSAMGGAEPEGERLGALMEGGERRGEVVTTEDFRRACQRDAWLYGSGLD